MTVTLLSVHRSPHLRQFMRFVVVGAGNTTLSFVAYRLMLLVGTPYLVAAPAAFGVGALNGYVFNRRWTFAAADSLRARVLYFTFAAIGAGITSVLVLLFVREAGTGKVLAYVFAIPPITVGMFAANRLWTFPGRA